MNIDKAAVADALSKVTLPESGQSLMEADIVRALTVEAGKVRFVIEVDPAKGRAMEPVRAAAQAAVEAIAGAGNVSAVLTAHQAKAPPNLKVGRHPTPQKGPQAVPGVQTIIAVGSGKGGVGKSTVSANIAAALAQRGLKVGLLDADVYGPSQPRMFGLKDQRPASPDGKIIMPLHAHGVTLMSIGFMLREAEAVVWRGPMLMGTLQQFLTQVAWGALDVLIVDLPPGTGDIQLTLSQKFHVGGAVLVSTPQDIALIDARKAFDMFKKLKTPVLGMVENMAAYICPNCGHEAHLFGHGGVRKDADHHGIPFLGEVPLDLAIREASDGGTPIVVSHPDSPQAQAFRAIASGIADGAGLVSGSPR